MTLAFMENFGQTAGFGVPGRENDRDGRSRELFLTDGNTVKLEARDPYGHWYITYKEGRTPDELKFAAFTSPHEAKRFLEQWLNTNRTNTYLSDKKVEIPELKTKKDK